MKLRTRVGIVVFTLGTCFLSAWIQIKERRAERDPVPSELFDVVQSGILALRAQRYEQAYLQASTAYRERLQLDHFVEMARSDCVAIRQAIRWEFGMPAARGSTTEVPVHFFLRSGEVLHAAFTLVRESRAWKMERVHIPLRPEPARVLGGMRL